MQIKKVVLFSCITRSKVPLLYVGIVKCNLFFTIPFCHELIQESEHVLMPMFCNFFGSFGVHPVFQQE